MAHVDEPYMDKYRREKGEATDLFFIDVPYVLQSEEMDDLLPRRERRGRVPEAEWRLHPLLQQEHEELRAHPARRQGDHAAHRAEVCMLNYSDKPERGRAYSQWGR